MKRILFSTLCVLLLAAGSASAYVERNMLRNQADEAKLKTVLVPDQKWVPFPAYNDRAGWDKVMGSWKETFIERGEKALDYRWQVVTATDYLTHNRGQSQGKADAHIGANLMAIIDLFFAELATGQGRYMDQLMDGTFAMCEVTSWVRSHHLSHQKSHRYFPEYDDNAIDLVAGDVGAVMAWVYYYFHEEFDGRETVLIRKRTISTTGRPGAASTACRCSPFAKKTLTALPRPLTCRWNQWTSTSTTSRATAAAMKVPPTGTRARPRTSNTLSS